MDIYVDYATGYRIWPRGEYAHLAQQHEFHDCSTAVHEHPVVRSGTKPGIGNVIEGGKPVDT
jgi:hypothetical protein